MINDMDLMEKQYSNVKNSNGKKSKRGKRGHYAINRNSRKYDVGKIVWGPNSRVAFI